MKLLVTIWVGVLITLIGGFWYVNSTINHIVFENMSQPSYEGHSDISMSGPEAYTVTSYGAVKLQVTISDASLQWGESPINKVFN